MLLLVSKQIYFVRRIYIFYFLIRCYVDIVKYHMFVKIGMWHMMKRIDESMTFSVGRASKRQPVNGQPVNDANEGDQ